MARDEIGDLVEKLKNFKPGNPLKHFITHARFPKFKNIEPDTRIDFQFPITALVGANGIGKTSVLHALWGMPFKYSTSRFWFATDLDPIEGSNQDPQRFIYGHWNGSFKGIVETRKARVGRKRDYWEPTRLIPAEGMEPMPKTHFSGKSKDRWNPVKRNVVYINLKAAFGSFDRYFYFESSGVNEPEKKRVMLREARRLKSIVTRNKTSYILGGHQRIFENRSLKESELQAVSEVLGREYTAARIIRHSLYPGHRGQDLSVIFQRGLEYSEAFAGSGEVAAVSAVVDVLSAPDYSLILLDEPETSLHPGAQRALLRFLLEQIKLKKHQIIISTHSPEYLEGLPRNAIKVFEDNGSGQARVIGECSSHVALHRLGKASPNKRRILVEDSLSELLVVRARKLLDPGDANALEIRVAPGGAESILTYHGPTAMSTGDNIYIYLDGDKRKVDHFSDPDTIAPAQYAGLPALVEKEIGCKPKLLIPGGDDAQGHEKAKVAANLTYLSWLRRRLAYLPRRVPEECILSALRPDRVLDDKTAEEIKSELAKELTGGGEYSGGEILTFQKLQINKLPPDNEDLLSIRNQLESWLRDEAVP